MARCVLFAEVAGFYAAVARADDPALSGRPVIVGGDPRKRGRVQSATPDALDAGVAVEMPVLEALQRCPAARAVRTDMSRYREVSRRLFAALRGVHSQLETFGLGGLYCDLSGRDAGAEALAERMVSVVSTELGLDLQVGLGSGKFLARLAAAEVAGPGGVHRVPAGEEGAFLAPLPAGRLDGVGRKTAATLAALGAQSIGDVVALGRDRLQEAFGPHGLRIHACAAASDSEPVRSTRHPQSVSRESTVDEETLDTGVLLEQLAGLSQQLESELERLALAAGRVAVKVRFTDHGTTSRSATLPTPTAAANELLEVASRLLARTQAGALPIRGLGIQLSLLAPAGDADRQLDLFRPTP